MTPVKRLKKRRDSVVTGLPKNYYLLLSERQKVVNGVQLSTKSSKGCIKRVMEAISTGETSFEKAYERITDCLFDKCYSLKNEKDGMLSYEYAVDRLAAIQSEVNSLKVQIPADQKEKWRRHTWLTNPTREIPFHFSHTFHLEYCTRAFLKFYEILLRFSNLVPNELPLNKSFRSLHLCEAPGAFISALNVYTFLYRDNVRKRWMWYANRIISLQIYNRRMSKFMRYLEWFVISWPKKLATFADNGDTEGGILNPHYEWNEPCSLFLDDELITATYGHWLFGPDNSGDILMWDQKYNSSLELSVGKFELITADGSMYCQDDPEQQESATLPLIKAEVEIALQLLVQGGCLVVKMYTVSMGATVRLLLTMMHSFEVVQVYKPSCSKPGNSEVYLICEGYLRDSLLDIPQNSEICESILDCAQFFANLQKDMLNFNLQTFPVGRESLFINAIRRKQDTVLRKFEAWLKTGQLSQIGPDVWLSARDSLPKSFSCCMFDCKNPWNFRQLHGQVESLRNIPSDSAVCELNKMLLCAHLLGKFDTPKQTFRIELCASCCNWTVGKEEYLKMQSDFLNPSFGLVGSMRMKQSLFIDLRTIVLLNVAEVLSVRLNRQYIRSLKDYTDFCEVSCKAKGFPIHVLTRGVSIVTEHFYLETHRDWVYVLQRLCDNEMDVHEVRCSAKNVLIVSRFSASVFAALTLLFEEVFIELNASSWTTLSCKRKRKHVRSLLEYLKALEDSIRSSSGELLEFIPIYYFRCKKFHTSIHEYNTTAVLRICSQNFSATRHQQL